MTSDFSAIGARALAANLCLVSRFFFDLETWRPNRSGSRRHKDAVLWRLMSRYEPRIQPGLQTLIRNHSQKPLEVCKQSLARMSMQEKVILRCRGMVKSQGNYWYVVHPRPPRQRTRPSLENPAVAPDGPLDSKFQLRWGQLKAYLACKRVQGLHSP